MSGERVIREGDTDTSTVRTRPCWICGQHSYIAMPNKAWNNFALNDVPLDIAWPDGPAADKQLIRTGVHSACWDEEFPDDNQGEPNA